MTRMPTFEHTFFDHSSVMFGPLGQNFFMGTQETVIYLLVKRNPRYRTYIPILIFWADFGGKIVAVVTRYRKSVVPQNPATGLTFLVNCYLENLF